MITVVIILQASHATDHAAQQLFYVNYQIEFLALIGRIHLIFSSNHDHLIILMAYCDRCERQFTSNRALEQHEEDSNAHWLCHDCGLDFASFYDRQEHHIHNHYYCKECDRLFDLEESKIDHMAAWHLYCRLHDKVSNSIPSPPSLHGRVMIN